MGETGAELTSIGLFGGIGGFERGFARAGIETVAVAEIDLAARAVLQRRFSSRLLSDVRAVRRVPATDILAAGFPCQDLSQVGRTNGITGRHSGLVDEVFRLLERPRRSQPSWVVLENVPFMLRIGRGAAMRHLMTRFQALGYSWAYRVIDARAFGLPQRRRRVVIVASRAGDPRAVLLGTDTPTEYDELDDSAAATGFYWTEGNGGIGWARNAVPPLKSGSAVGISSPPAVWLRETDAAPIVTPGIRTAERLQGFPAGWTAPALTLGRSWRGARWRLVGNAVCVPLARWLGDRIVDASRGASAGDLPLEIWEADPYRSWPETGYVVGSTLCGVGASDHPVRRRFRDIAEFMASDHEPLSRRAAVGFLSRIQQNSLARPQGFEAALVAHIAAATT